MEPSDAPAARLSFNDMAPAELVQTLLGAQRLCVLATHSTDAGPYTSLLAFAPDQQLRRVLFVTPRETRKYASLKADPRCALLFDNRTLDACVYGDAVAVTALGTVREVGDDERAQLLARFVALHPPLERFATAPSTALCALHVDLYKVQKLHRQDDWDPAAP